MRKIRHLSLLIILGGLSLSGIAFSSWITTNSNPSFDVSIDVGSVNNSSRYFAVNSFTPFKYNSEGFINEDTPTQTSLSRALISSVIKYNVKQAKAEISNLSSLSLKLTYKHLYSNEVSSSEQTNNLYAYNVVLTTDEQGLIIYKPASGAHPYLVQTLSSLENIVILLEPDESGTLKIRIRSATGDNAILSKRTVRLYIIGWK